MFSYYDKSGIRILATLVLLLGSATAQAGHECRGFTLTSYVTLLSPAGPAVGTAEAVMDDGTVFQVTAEGEIISTKMGDDGTIHMEVRETDHWGSLGTTLGLDQVKLIATATPGEYEVNIKTHIVGDSGYLEEVMGRYHGKGTVSFNTGAFTHSGRGRICNLP